MYIWREWKTNSFIQYLYFCLYENRRTLQNVVYMYNVYVLLVKMSHCTRGDYMCVWICLETSMNEMRERRSTQTKKITIFTSLYIIKTWPNNIQSGKMRCFQKPLVRVLYTFIIIFIEKNTQSHMKTTFLMSLQKNIYPLFHHTHQFYSSVIHE